MSPAAPINVPVELSPAGGVADDRVFRLARAISTERLLLAAGLPDEPAWLAGRLELLFHLPGDPTALRCGARAGEVVVDEATEREHAERRALLFADLAPEAAERIGRYIEARLEQP